MCKIKKKFFFLIYFTYFDKTYIIMITFVDEFNSNVYFLKIFTLLNYCLNRYNNSSFIRYKFIFDVHRKVDISRKVNNHWICLVTNASQQRSYTIGLMPFARLVYGLWFTVIACATVLTQFVVEFYLLQSFFCFLNLTN